jgi:hypothetical protein
VRLEMTRDAEEFAARAGEFSATSVWAVARRSI